VSDLLDKILLGKVTRIVVLIWLVYVISPIDLMPYNPIDDLVVSILGTIITNYLLGKGL